MKRIMLILVAICLLLSGCAFSEPKEVITFTAVHTYDYYTKAIETYNESHEIPVKLENFDLVVSNTVQSSTEGNSAVPKEDEPEQAVRPWMDLKFENYEKVVHTGIMSKNGFDIIDMSGLDHNKYAEKGLLVDFDELAANDPSFSWDDYDKNIIDRLRTDDGLFVLPLSVSTSTIVVNANTFEDLGVELPKELTWSTLLDSGEKLSTQRKAGKTNIYPFMKVSSYEKLSIQMFDQMLRKELYTTWIDKNAKSHRFGEQYFLDTLKLFQAFDDIEYASSELFTGSDGYERSFTECAFVTLPILSYNNSYQKQFLENWRFLGEPTLETVEKPMTSLQSTYYSISKDSAHIQEAWEFLKLLISGEAQSDIGTRMQSTYQDFPINLKARAAMREKEQMASLASSQSNGSITDEDITQIDEMLANAYPYPRGDNQLRQGILLEAEKFFLGQKSADETAEEIAKRVELYINE